MPITFQKHLLLRWIGWFFFANILLSIFIQSTYLLIMPTLSNVYGITLSNTLLAYFFLAVSYVAHATILNAVWAVLVVLLAWLIPRKAFIFSLSILLSLSLVVATVIDRVAYRLFHSHQFAVGISVLKSGAVTEVMPLSGLEYLFLAIMIVALVAAELLIAWYVWKRVVQQATQQRSAAGFIVAALLAVCIGISYTMMAFVVTVKESYRFNDVRSHLLLKMAQLVPYYQIVYTWLIPVSPEYYRTWHIHNQAVSIQTVQPNEPLDYPLHPLQCQPPHKKPNILFLVFDTLRYDSLTPRIMPNMADFARKTVQFDRVYSGGNCTQPGVFSLFYGIPANYWNATVEQHKGPVLIDELNQSGYQMGIFASASLLFPQFNQNVFVNVKQYSTETVGDTSMSRDKKITQLFQAFIQKRDPNKPFFSFIFYDSVHNYCEGSGNEFMTPFKPAVAQCARFSLTSQTDATPYENRYHNAAYFLDQQAAQVIATLKAHHLLDNTIVVVTADHGEQHNDQRMGYWSHASAYTPYQLHVPMLVYWPGMQPQHRQYFATNFDVVPMLLQKVFHCRNPLIDYTVGQSLLNRATRSFLISGSYTDYAYVTPQQSTRIYPGGDYVMTDALGHPLYRTQLNLPLLQAGSSQLRRYYQVSKSGTAHSPDVG